MCFVNHHDLVIFIGMVIIIEIGCKEVEIESRKKRKLYERKIVKEREYKRVRVKGRYLDR